jgi:hypothetical protein
MLHPPVDAGGSSHRGEGKVAYRNRAPWSARRRRYYRLRRRARRSVDACLGHVRVTARGTSRGPRASYATYLKNRGQGEAVVPTGQLYVVLNWQEELKRLVPTN